MSSSSRRGPRLPSPPRRLGPAAVGMRPDLGRPSSAHGRGRRWRGQRFAAVYDPTAVHAISVEFDPAAFEAMVETFRSTGDKEWIRATVTIDGTRFEDVGLRLKGNSTLREVSTDSDPAQIPWLIKLHEFVDGQDIDGYSQFVLRASSTQTALTGQAGDLVDADTVADVAETISAYFDADGTS